MILTNGTHGINNEILPCWMINITAIILPWLEICVGILIIAGIFVGACTIIQISLLLIFTATISINIARGLDFSCGCFSEGNTASGMNYQHIIFNHRNSSMLCIGVKVPCSFSIPRSSAAG